MAPSTPERREVFISVGWTVSVLGFKGRFANRRLDLPLKIPTFFISGSLRGGARYGPATLKPPEGLCFVSNTPAGASFYC
jgi:hypothetical protein